MNTSCHPLLGVNLGSTLKMAKKKYRTIAWLEDGAIVLDTCSGEDGEYDAAVMWGNMSDESYEDMVREPNRYGYFHVEVEVDEEEI
jgi:hypothetical protein